MTTDLTQAAQAAIEAARIAAKELGSSVTVAVCDAGGHLIALTRESRALLASLESAQTKARTAVYFGVETRHLPGEAPVTPALLAAVPYPLAFLPGGIPLRSDDGALLGAVGVGGGNAQQDQTIAQVAALAWKHSKKEI
jgi:uncharacterized protein GlcG (DUF336 family)